MTRLFPKLWPDAPASGPQFHQTLALLLLPMGLTLLAIATAKPGPPPLAMWGLAALAGGGTFLFAILWEIAQRRPLPGIGLCHYLTRQTLILLCPFLLSFSAGAMIQDTELTWPFTLVTLWLVCVPISRILVEAADARQPPAPPYSRPTAPSPARIAAMRLNTAGILARMAGRILCTLGILGLLQGWILEANKDYPTNPATLLLLLWLAAAMVVLGGSILALAQIVRLREESADATPRPLSPPPVTPSDSEASAPPAAPKNWFGSEQF